MEPTILEKVFYSQKFADETPDKKLLIIEDLKKAFEGDLAKSKLSIADAAVVKDKFKKDLATKMNEIMDVPIAGTLDGLKYKQPVGTIAPTTKEEALKQLDVQKSDIEKQDKMNNFEAQDAPLVDETLNIAFPAGGMARKGIGIAAGDASAAILGSKVAKAETAMLATAQGTSEAINDLTPDKFKQEHPTYYTAMQLLGTLLTAGTVGSAMYKNPTIERYKRINNAVKEGKITPTQADEAVADANKIAGSDISDAQKFLEETKQPKVSDGLGGVTPPEELKAKIEPQIDEQVTKKIDEMLPNVPPEVKQDIQRRVNIELKNRKPEKIQPVNTIPERKLSLKQEQIKEASIPKIGGSEDEAKQAVVNIMNEKQLDSEYKSMSKKDLEHLNREYEANEELKRWAATGEVFANSSGHIGTGLIAGVSQDKDGNYTLDPIKFIAGMGGFAAVKAMVKNPTVRKELKDFAQKALNKVEGNPMFDMKSNLFTKAKETDKGAFSDTATKQLMKEIDDGKAKVSNGTWGTSEDIKAGNSTTARLDEILEHKELFKKYPELKNTIVHLKPDMQGASFDADANRIIVGYDTKTKSINKSSLLHEIQHSIQDKEGWARGGSPENIQPKDMYETIIGKYGSLPAIKKIENDFLNSKIPTENKMYEKVINMASNNYGGIEKLKYDTYKRLYGEQQARATQLRKDMTLEQRAKESWTDTIKRVEGEYKKPIVKYDDGVANSEKPQTNKEIEKSGEIRAKKIQSSPTVGAGLIGASAGIEVDKQGNISYNLAKGAIGATAALGILKGGPKLTKTIFYSKKVQSVFNKIKDADITDKILGHKIYNKKDYMNIRETAIKAENIREEKYLQLHNTLNYLQLSTRNLLHEYMTTRAKDIKLPKELKDFADSYTKYINKKRQELVNLKVLEQPQLDRFLDIYQKRSYLKDMKGKKANGGGGRTIDKVYARGNVWTGSKEDLKTYQANNELGSFDSGKIEFTKLKNGQYRFNQDWSKEQRAIWGEITDIAYILPNTLRRLDSMVIHAKMLDKVAKTAYSFAEEVPNTTLLNGKRFGALNGKYVSADVASDIEDFNSALFGRDPNKLLSDEAMDVYYGLSTFWKKSHTVYSPTAHLNNLLSNVTIMYMEGINPTTAVHNALKGVFATRKIATFRDLTAKKIIGLTEEESKTLFNLGKDDDLLLYLKAEESGLFGRSRLKDVLSDSVQKMPDIGKTGILNKINEEAMKMYAGEDNIMRFSLLRALLSKAKNKLSFDEAITRVNNTIPDYTKPMSAWAKFGRKSMLTPFISWTYYATPIILRQAIEHPERVATIAGVLYGINKLVGIDPLNESDIPQKNFSMKRIPIYKNGDEVTTIKIDRWIPMTDLLSPVDFTANLVNGGAWKTIPEVLTNTNYYYSSKITRKEGLQKAYDLSKYAIQSITPDIIDNVWNLAESKLLSKKRRTRHPVIVPRTTTQEALKFIGLNVLSYNKKAQADKVKFNKIKEETKPIRDALVKARTEKLSDKEKQNLFKNLKTAVNKGYISTDELKRKITTMIKNQLFINMGTTSAEIKEKKKELKNSKTLLK